VDTGGAWRGPAESSAECESAIVSPRQIEFNRTHREQLLTSTQSPAAAAGCSCCCNSAGCCVLLVMSHTEQYFTLHIDNVYFCNRKIFLKTSRSRLFCFTSFIFSDFGQAKLLSTILSRHVGWKRPAGRAELVKLGLLLLVTTYVDLISRRTMFPNRTWIVYSVLSRGAKAVVTTAIRRPFDCLSKVIKVTVT